MTSRDIIRTILAKDLPERMGLYEHFWPETLRDYWPEQGFPKDESPSTYFDYDIVPCGSWLNKEPFPNRLDVVKETDEWKTTRNGYGATMRNWNNKSGVPEHIGFDVTTPEKWKEYREPLLSLDMSRLGNLDEARAELARLRESDKFIVIGNAFIFELMRATIGDEHFLPALLLEPEWIHDFCQVYLDFFRNHYSVLFREVGLPDGLFLYEDFGYTNGLFCSPGTMADLVMPYERQLVEFFHDYGLPVILHSCGDVRQAVPLIIEAGFDCLQPMEAKAGCDVAELARTYGNRIAYMGNINVVPLSTNRREDVEAEILPKLRAAREMRIPYIFHSDHSIPPSINLDTYRYALDLFRANCAY